MKVNWLVVVLFVVIGVLAFQAGVGMVGGWGYGGRGSGGYGGWGMMGPWMMGGPFMMLLWPLGFIVLLVLGITWLVNSSRGRSGPGEPAGRCPNCGQPVQSDWKHCANCGRLLR